MALKVPRCVWVGVGRWCPEVAVAGALEQVHAVRAPGAAAPGRGEEGEQGRGAGGSGKGEAGGEGEVSPDPRAEVAAADRGALWSCRWILVRESTQCPAVERREWKVGR